MTDLSLANNHIKQIQNLEALQKLEVSHDDYKHVFISITLTHVHIISSFTSSVVQVLSLANNEISNMADIVQLRELPNLKVLSLEGKCIYYKRYKVLKVIVGLRD